jgi:hypothetical protein
MFSKVLAESRLACPPSPLSVRYFSARSGSVPGYDDGEGLKLEVPLAQSAFSPLLSAAWLKIAQHCPGRSHAILAHTVGITLQGQLNITVAKQSLYGFWVSSNADQKRCQAAVAPNGRYRHSRYFREGVSPFQSMVTFAFELPLTRAQLQHEGISRQPRGSRMRFVKTSLSNHGLATIGR